ncbi:MAG: hypothetical protein V3W44_10845 [Dehalococcoidales bacterium]
MNEKQTKRTGTYLKLTPADEARVDAYEKHLSERLKATLASAKLPKRTEVLEDLVLRGLAAWEGEG